MKFSLKAKILLSFFILITLPVIVLGYVSYNRSAEALQATIEQGLNDETKFTAEKIDLTLNEVESFLQIASKAPALSNLLISNDKKDKSEAFDFLVKLQSENNELLESIILTDISGKVILNNESQSSNIDLSNRDYVQKGIKGLYVVSDVIFSKITNRPVIAVAQPIKQGNEVVGLLVATIRFEQISKHAAQIKIGENGYAYMINKSGDIIYHPSKEKVLKENIGNTDNAELKVLVEKMKSQEVSSGFYTYEGIYKFVSFRPVGNWILVSTANYDEYMAPAIQIKKDILIINSIALIVALLIAYFIASHIVNPIKQLEILMDKAGHGDLTVKAEVKTKDEIKELGDSFNKMITSQVEIVEHVRSGAHELAASSQEMAASSEQLSSASQQINASVQQVALDADTQSHSVIEASKALVQLSSLVQMAHSKALAANNNSEKTKVTAQHGRTKVNETVQAMAEISNKTNDSAQAIQELNSITAKIGEIINTINAIAAQTDLLALNAAIEAARAGEHGRGFAVVAEEVRKLSEESHRGASEIVTLVNQMVKQTEEAVETMGYGQQAVDNGVNVVKETDKSFAEIITAVEETVKNIQEIVDITNDEVATSDQIVSLIDDVSTITENNTANCQEVAAAVEEQTASVETITSAAEENSAMATSLENLVKEFKINE